MLYAERYAIQVEYEKEVKTVCNVDADKYSYFTLFQDVYKM